MAKNLAIISREIFFFSFGFLLISILMEIIWPNIILAYFNLNYLFVFSLIFGSISLIKK